MNPLTDLSGDMSIRSKQGVPRCNMLQWLTILNDFFAAWLTQQPACHDPSSAGICLGAQKIKAYEQ